MIDSVDYNLFFGYIFYIFFNCGVKLGGCVFFLLYGWINVFYLVEGFY